MAGLFSAILGGPRAADQGGNPADNRLFASGLGGKSLAGPMVGQDTALQVSTVYAATNLLAKTVAALPVMTFLENGSTQTPLPNHALTEILEYEPNRWQSGFDFRAMLMTHLALRGNAYAEIIPGRRGAVDQLEPIHPDRVRPFRSSDGDIAYRLRGGSGVPDRILLQDEVLHIRSAIAPGGIQGISVIDYAMQTIGLALAAERHGATMFRNGARPSAAVQFPHTLGDEAFKRFKSDLEDNFYGEANVGRTLILEGGAEFKPITMTADQIQFLQTRQFQIEEIARWFDVPLVLLHHMTQTTSWGTGVESIMLAFVRNNLMPWLRAWEQQFRRSLIVAKGLYTVAFDVEQLIRGDSEAQANFFSRLVLNGIMTRNEARARLRLPPLAGLDTPLTPSNTTTNDGMVKNGNAAGLLDLNADVATNPEPTT